MAVVGKDDGAQSLAAEEDVLLDCLNGARDGDERERGALVESVLFDDSEE